MHTGQAWMHFVLSSPSRPSFCAWSEPQDESVDMQHPPTKRVPVFGDLFFTLQISLHCAVHKGDAV